MNVSRNVCFLAAAVAVLFSSGTHATAIYSYLGNKYGSIVNPSPPTGSYTSQMRVSGEIELANALPSSQSLSNIGGDVLAFSFNDGRNTFTDLTNFGISSIWVGTDSGGNIDSWTITLRTNYPTPTVVGSQKGGIETHFDRFDVGAFDECTTVDSNGCKFGKRDSGEIAGNPGTWRLTVTQVPEPGTLGLLVMSLFGLGWRARKA